jgi:hypothetical protein
MGRGVELVGGSQVLKAMSSISKLRILTHEFLPLINSDSISTQSLFIGIGIVVQIE